MSKSLQERFDERYVIGEENDKPGAPGPCWDWTAGRNNRGYGQIYTRRSNGAHRVSYELHVGPIPTGLHVRHQCDRPCCVNPAHLLVGTRSDNMQDAVRRGTNVNAAKTHCPVGHEYTDENTYTNGKSRDCRICAATRRRERRAKNRDAENARRRERRAENREAENAKRREQRAEKKAANFQAKK
jgi:hypothetical protein